MENEIEINKEVKEEPKVCEVCNGIPPENTEHCEACLGLSVNNMATLTIPADWLAQNNAAYRSGRPVAPWLKANMNTQLNSLASKGMTPKTYAKVSSDIASYKKGGTIKKTGLAYMHKGEKVIPTGKKGRAMERALERKEEIIMANTPEEMKKNNKIAIEIDKHNRSWNGKKYTYQSDNAKSKALKKKMGSYSFLTKRGFRVDAPGETPSQALSNAKSISRKHEKNIKHFDKNNSYRKAVAGDKLSGTYFKYDKEGLHNNYGKYSQIRPSRFRKGK